MEIYKDVKKEFLTKYDRFEPVVLDHTALITYKRCPTEYFYRFVLGFAPKETPPYFISGSCYHKYREHFEIVWKANGDLEYLDRFDLSHILAESEALKLWDKKTGGKPLALHTKWDWVTRERLQKSLAVTKDWLAIEKKNGNIVVVATEQPFIVQIVDGVFWGGKADQVVRWNNRLWGRDFKTSSKEGQYFKRTLKPNNQFIGYTIAEELLHGNSVDGQLVEVLYNTKTAGPKITPYPNSFNTFEKGLWKKDLAIWSERLEDSRVKDHYPRAEVNCAFCPFHMVCSASSENAMQAVLESQYKVSPWDFMNTDDNIEVVE